MKVCSEEGCDRASERRGLCSAHYQRLWSQGRVHEAPLKQQQTFICPHCGPYTPHLGPPADECTICWMTPGEHAYRLRILADSIAVYAEEAAEFRRQRSLAAEPPKA